MFDILKRLKDLYEWSHFADAALATLQTKFGYAVVGGFFAMLIGAWAKATWYEIILMGLAVFVVINVYSILRILRRTTNLEILFEPNDEQYVRPEISLYGPVGEFYSVAVNNRGGATLTDVSLRALDSFFTRVIISESNLSRVEFAYYRRGTVPIREIAALHPQAPEPVQLFGLSFNCGVTAPDYILNTVQKFTLELVAKDTPAIRRLFEYNPKSRPMLRMLP
jgi:hypothetical protein